MTLKSSGLSELARDRVKSALALLTRAQKLKGDKREELVRAAVSRLATGVAVAFNISPLRVAILNCRITGELRLFGTGDAADYGDVEKWIPILRQGTEPRDGGWRIAGCDLTHVTVGKEDPDFAHMARRLSFRENTLRGSRHIFLASRHDFAANFFESGDSNLALVLGRAGVFLGNIASDLKQTIVNTCFTSEKVANVNVTVT
jgi:hypothetical protein